MLHDTFGPLKGLRIMALRWSEPQSPRKVCGWMGSCMSNASVVYSDGYCYHHSQDPEAVQERQRAQVRRHRQQMAKRANLRRQETVRELQEGFQTPEMNFWTVMRMPVREFLALEMVAEVLADPNQWKVPEAPARSRRHAAPGLLGLRGWPR